MKNILFLFLFLNFIFGSNLKEIINLSLQNEQIKASLLNEDINKDEILSLNNGYLPSLSLKGGINYKNGEIGLFDPNIASKISLNIDFSLYDPSKNPRIKALEYSKNANRLKSMDLKNFLALQAVNLYFAYQSNYGLLRAQKFQNNFLKTTLDKLEKSYKNGLSGLEEYEAFSAKYQLALSEYYDLKQKIIEIKNELELLTNTKITPINGARLSVDNLKNENLQIIAMNNDYLALLQKAKITKSNLLPKIFISNEFSYSKLRFNKELSPNLDKLLSTSNLYKDTNVQNNFILGFTWKIFDFFSNSYSYESDRKKIIQSKLLLDYKKRENDIKIQNLKLKINTLKEKIKANKLNLKSSDMSLNITKKKYEAGISSYNDLLLALSLKFQAQAKLIINKNELEIFKAQLIYANGDNIISKVFDE